jgi:hypothetical protein
VTAATPLQKRTVTHGRVPLLFLDHDGKGNITFEERPFVVMADRAYVDLGVVEKTKPAMKMAK